MEVFSFLLWQYNKRSNETEVGHRSSGIGTVTACLSKISLQYKKRNKLAINTSQWMIKGILHPFSKAAEKTWFLSKNGPTLTLIFCPRKNCVIEKLNNCDCTNVSTKAYSPPSALISWNRCMCKFALMETELVETALWRD